MPCDGPVHLRRATLADAAGIATVHNEAWIEAHAGLVPPDALHCLSSSLREGFWREELLVESHDRAPWVALLDERVIGFAVGGMSRDDGADGETGKIYQLFVDPECWSQGIRTNLVAHVVRDLAARGYDRLTIWVLAADVEMRAFMHHIGWTADGATREEDCGGVTVEQVRYVHAIH